MIDEGRIIIDQDAEDLRMSGTTVAGPRGAVDSFVASRPVLHREGVGGLASVTVEALSPAARQEATAAGLELSPVSLQQLIVRKTNTSTKEFEQSA